MKRLLLAAVVCTVGIGLIGICRPAKAQDKVNLEKRQAEIERFLKPLLDPGTIAVGRLDVTRVKSLPLVEELQKTLELPAADVQQAQQFVAGLAGQFQAAGGKEIYVIVSLTDLPLNPPLLVVPMSAGANVEQLKKLLQQTNSPAIKRIGNMLVAGGEAALARVSNGPGSSRPELVAALAAMDDAALQVAVSLSADQRRAAQETLPALPPQLGGGSSAPLALGWQWLAVGLDMAPNPGLRLVVQCQDEQAAQELDKSLQSVWQASATIPQVKQILGQPPELLNLLTPRRQGDRLTLSLDSKSGSLQTALKAAQGPIIAARQATTRMEAVNQVKQIGLAMHQFADVYKTLPPAYSKNKEDKPLLSWRVHVLPYLGEHKLHGAFHMDEPWDSEHNKALIKQMPGVYAMPDSRAAAEGRTVYCVPRGDGTAFPGKDGVGIAQITDGTSNTVMLVEVDEQHAVPWTQPDDWTYENAQPFAGLGGHFGDIFIAGFCDGSVRTITQAADPANWRAQLTKAGGEVTH